MITRYNRLQILRAAISLCIGVGAFVVAWLFFKFVVVLTNKQWGGTWTEHQAALLAWGCLAVVAISGFVRWRIGGGHHLFHESGMMITAEPQTGLGFHVHEQASRVSAWSYLLGQIFLAGPLQVLGAFTKLRERIPPSPTLEAELLAFRDELRSRKRWVEISDYPGRELHVAYLSRLGLIDFSPRKGTMKAR